MKHTSKLTTLHKSRCVCLGSAQKHLEFTQYSTTCRAACLKTGIITIIMTLEKRFLKDGKRCKVTFRITSKTAGYAEKASVVGDFNGWDSAAGAMRKLKDGSFSLSLSIPSGTVYQFRYLLDQDIWISDDDGDGYAYCDFGCCSNSVLNLLDR